MSTALSIPLTCRGRLRSRWRDRVSEEVSPDFEFLGTVFRSLGDLSAHIYRDLVQVDFS